MGYLVKASFNAEPRAYSLDRIKSDVSAKSLPTTALVRHEQQDFWYSVGELIGETPTTEFQFTCPCCNKTTNAREIDVGLDIPCQKCGAMDQAPDIQPIKDPTPDRPLLRWGKLLLLVGGFIVYGDLQLNFSGQNIFGRVVINLVGVCMMINGYGKVMLYYRKHPRVIDPAASFFK